MLLYHLLWLKTSKHMDKVSFSTNAHLHRLLPKHHYSYCSLKRGEIASRYFMYAGDTGSWVARGDEVRHLPGSGSWSAYWQWNQTQQESNPGSCHLTPSTTSHKQSWENTGLNSHFQPLAEPLANISTYITHWQSPQRIQLFPENKSKHLEYIWKRVETAPPVSI